MDGESWRQVEALFEEARHLSFEDRAALLERSRDLPADVLRQVRRLLDADSGADRDRFLSVPPVSVPLPELEPEVMARRLVGRRVGPYRLIDVVGSGGMGTVYLAERDDAAFEKRVAVKLIKSGMGTDEMLERFRIERQVLADLEHPNIERLLDGGTSEDGFPYLVTEYIDGLPIDSHCDGKGLSVTERLRLFRSVCDAVQYAHQKLVVHRDLKPGNILVTSDGTVRLLDFGIAKILTPDASSDVTTRAQGPLTPDYASPEQVRGRPITTASDIYSLGIVLYRLMTGRGPYRLTTQTPSEIERVVCETEPTKPSVAVLRDGASRPERLARRLKGDIDTIVSKALRKEPEHRYASVAQLSDDIDRHLRGLPLLARKPTLRYRVTKFVERNRAAVVAGVLVVSFLVLGVAAVVRESDRARREADVSREVLAYIDEVLQQFPGRGTASLSTVSDFLSRGVDRAASRLSDQPDAQARLLETIAGIYESYDLLPGAIDTRQRILALREEYLEEGDPAVIAGIRELAAVLLQAGRADEAEKLLSRAIAFDRTGGVMHLLGMASWEQGRFDRAEELLERASEGSLARASSDGDRIGRQIDVGRFYHAAARYAAAEELLQKALREASEHEGDQSPLSIRAMQHLARTLHELERSGEADSLLRRAIASTRRSFGYDHPLTAELLRELALVRVHRMNTLGLHRPADLLARQAMKTHETLLGDRHREVGRSQLGFARTARDPIEREVRARRALETLRAVLPAGHVELADPLVDLGRLRVLAGSPGEAEPILREAYEIRLRRLPAGHWSIADAGEALGHALVAAGRFEEAEPFLVEALSALEGEGLSIRLAAERALRDLVALHVATGDGDRAMQYRRLLRERRVPVPIPPPGPGREPPGVALDYDDDCAEKTIHLTTEDLSGARTTLWIFGKPFNWAGGRFEDRRDYLIRVNDDPGQEYPFDVGVAFHENTESYNWIPFDLPSDWLRPGENRFLITESSPEGSWDHNNLMIGTSVAEDLDASWFCSNDRPCCYGRDGRQARAVEFAGELMIFLELGGEAVGIAVSRTVEQDWQLGLLLVGIGETLLDAGEWAAAERSHRAALDEFRGADHRPGLAAAELGLGGSLVASGRAREAEPYLLRAASWFSYSPSLAHRTALSRLIEAYEADGATERAEEYRRKLAEMPLPSPMQEPDPHKLADAGE